MAPPGGLFHFHKNDLLRKKYYELCNIGEFGEIYINMCDLLNLEMEEFFRIINIIVQQTLNKFVYPITLKKLLYFTNFF